jgi:cation diffusion facilitator family transporter
MNKKTSIALSSVFASAALTLLKLVVGLMTGSIGILSEAAHSLLDLGAATLTFFAVKIGDKPADERHPYGHGKVESISALIETGLLFVTSAWIIFEAIKRLFENRAELEVTWYAFAVMIISVIIDFSRSRALRKAAKETKSQALEADALHFSSDILSSLVVIAGLALSYMGVFKADAIAAIGVSLFVLHAGLSLGKRTIDVLVDAAPEGLTQKITKIALSVEGVIEVKKARVRNVGASSFIEMTVAVSRTLPLSSIKIITDAIEEKIRKIIPESDLTIETEPLSLSTETIIDQVQVIAHTHGLDVHDIAVHSESKKRYVSFDLEVDANTSLKKAHQISCHLEETLQEELGKDIEVNIHIEPLNTKEIVGTPISGTQFSKILETIQTIAREIAVIKEIHDIKIRKTRSHIFVSLHCVFNDAEELEKVHEATSILENRIRLEMPKIQRVLVHPEPESEKH